LKKKETVESYERQSLKTWKQTDFSLNKLEKSLSLFNSNNYPFEPINVNLYAYLSGLPFSKHLTQKISKIQNDVKNTIGHNDFYMVKPDNLGVEYAVLKWPDDQWSVEKELEAFRAIESYKFNEFKILFNGWQINEDGCLVVKGFDSSGSITAFREYIKSEIMFLPSKQSEWFHIPIGRILNRVGNSAFTQLRRMVEYSDNDFEITETIRNIKFIHEKKWYMEEKSVLFINGAI
jgi:hypothetical protein